MLKTIGAAAAACRLSPTDLAPDLSRESFRENLEIQWRQRAPGEFRYKTRTGRFFSFVKAAFGSLRAGLRAARPPEQGAVVVLAETKNQWRALQPIAAALEAEGVPTAAYVSKRARVDDADAANSETLARLRARGRLLAAPFFPLLVGRMLAAGGYTGRSFRWGLDTYWHAYGLYLAYRLWLTTARPTGVVVANDHSFSPCTMVKAARDAGVPTFYSQHASVTEKFPPLGADYALLDGCDAASKYASAGPSRTTAYLIGMPRYDGSPAAAIGDTGSDSGQRAGGQKRLGVCTSIADEPDRIEAMTRAVVAAGLGVAITLRPHPRTAPPVLDRLMRLIDELGLRRSPQTETAFEFLAGQDAIIAGASSILLEAALAGVTPICYELNPAHTDWYGFVRSGLCRSFAEPAPLVEFLRNDEAYRHVDEARAIDFCETVGTRWHGKSAQLAAGVIAAVARGQQPDPAVWRPVESGRVAGGTLRVFGLRRGA